MSSKIWDDNQVPQTCSTSELNLDDILEETCLYINPSFLQMPLDPEGFSPFDALDYTKDVKTNVTVLDLKDVYEKGQSRRKANSEQRLLNGDVHLKATSQQPLQGVLAYVERCPEAARILQDTNGRVPLEVVFSKREPGLINFSINLDSVYVSHKGVKVYELSRVKGYERNIFRLIVLVLFADGSTKEFTSKNFQVQSKKTLKNGQDRSDDEGRSSPGSSDNGYSTPSPENKRKRRKLSGFDSSPIGSISSGINTDSVSAGEIITDHLEARSATIDELQVKKPIVTQRGDIAYHFKLRKSELDIPLEEGDVIGFFEETDGKSRIEKLTHFNASKARLAGVISRSAYLEAKTPVDEDEKALDDLVCVMGMVSVKTLGPVQNGERIYASLEHPGIAIPQSRVFDAISNDVFLLGQTLEGLDAKHDDVNLVQSFVSVLLSITSGHVTQAVNDMRKHVKQDVKIEVKEVKRKCLRGFRRWLLAGFVLATLLAIFLYQWFAPGTALRDFRCRQGSIEGSDMWFTFTTNDEQIPRVHGIEFKFEKLKDKLDLTFDGINITDARYYLNLDRCTHGGIRPVGSPLDGKEMVRGAEIVAVVHNCTSVYYYSDGWEPYDSDRDIVCNTYP